MNRFFLLLLSALLLISAGCSAHKNNVTNNTFTSGALPDTRLTAPEVFTNLGEVNYESNNNGIQRHHNGFMFGEIKDNHAKRALYFKTITINKRFSVVLFKSDKNLIINEYVTINGKQCPSVMRIFYPERDPAIPDLLKKYSNFNVPNKFLVRETYFRVKENLLLAIIYGEDVSDLPYADSSWYSATLDATQKKRIAEFEKRFTETVDFSDVNF